MVRTGYKKCNHYEMDKMTMFDDKILNQIERGLTGETTHDLEYLSEVAESYKGSPEEQEARRSIGALYHQYVEPNVRLENDRKGLQAEGVREVIQEIEKLILKSYYPQALDVIEGLIYDIAYSGWLTEHKGRYHSFNTLFELILYSIQAPVEEELSTVQKFPMSPIYCLYAQILKEMDRVEEAKEALEQALIWNPVSAKIRLDYARIFYEDKDYETFFRETVKSLEYAYERADLARAYRYLGYYYTEKEKYREASLCYRMDLYFQPMDEQAKLELYYIGKKAPSVDTTFDADEMHRLCSEEGLPGGINDLVLKTAYACGIQAAKREDVRSATYYLNIYYSLTNDERVLETLKYLKDEADKEKYPDKVVRAKSQKQP